MDKDWGRCYLRCKTLDRRSVVMKNCLMPRQARLDSPGALHHIMVRGINKSAIFNEDEDKNRFIERLGEGIIDGRCAVYAWIRKDG